MRCFVLLQIKLTHHLSPYRTYKEGDVKKIRPNTAQAWKPYDLSLWPQHKLRIEAVITPSAKQKQGKIANVILIRQVPPRLFSFQQNCWTVWLRLDDFHTKGLFITHRFETAEECVRLQQMCHVEESPPRGQVPGEQVEEQISPAWATCSERNWQIYLQALPRICQTWCPQGCETEGSNIQLSIIV